MPVKCVVGYTKGINDGRVYGYVFDKLIPCCTEFARWFESTGARKITSFNHGVEREKNGFNLVSRGDVQRLVLQVDRTHSNTPETEIKFCPFCGTEVEVKCTKVVVLKRRVKEVFDGYDEEVHWKQCKYPPNTKATAV